MALKMTIGGAVWAFEAGEGAEVAGLLDGAFAADTDWRDGTARLVGDLTPEAWGPFRRRALETLGVADSENLQALGEDGGEVYLPANVCSVSFPLTRGGSLRCASLPGLRRELAELAWCWELPYSEEELAARLDAGDAADEERTFCLLALAANEALRRDCPLWLVEQR